jgi:hypothetical protein
MPYLKEDQKVKHKETGKIARILMVLTPDHLNKISSEIRNFKADGLDYLVALNQTAWDDRNITVYFDPEDKWNDENHDFWKSGEWEIIDPHRS